MKIIRAFLSFLLMILSIFGFTGSARADETGEPRDEVGINVNTLDERFAQTQGEPIEIKRDRQGNIQIEVSEDPLFQTDQIGKN